MQEQEPAFKWLNLKNQSFEGYLEAILPEFDSIGMLAYENFDGENEFREGALRALLGYEIVHNIQLPKRQDYNSIYSSSQMAYSLKCIKKEVKVHVTSNTKELFKD